MNADDEFGPELRACLGRAGWTPQRDVPVDREVRALEADGFDVFPSVRAFLRRFSGLTLQYPHTRQPGVEDSCHFDVLLAARRIHPAKVGHYAEYVGEPLCPFGEAARGHLTLLMTAGGTVYAAYDAFFLHLADDPVRMLRDFAAGRESGREIPLPGWWDTPGAPARDEAAGTGLDLLLAAASGPTGPQGGVDLGAPGLFAELSALLSRRNGFTAFDGGLRVFRLGGPGEGPELRAWNEPGLWKDAFSPLADNLFCFGQDVLGRQHSFDLAFGGIVVFEPDNATKLFAGDGFEEWAGFLLEEPAVNREDGEGRAEPTAEDLRRQAPEALRRYAEDGYGWAGPVAGG